MIDKKIIKGFLIDFDGVIAESRDMAVSFSYDYIKQYIPVISKQFIKDFCKAVNGFLNQEAIELLFNSLGIGSRVKDFYNRIINTKETYHEMVMFIDPDFKQFISLCRNRNYRYKIFSTNIPERITSICDVELTDIYTNEIQSKTNPLTYKTLINDLGIDQREWICLDDDPFVLAIAKYVGFQTIVMRNEIFSEDDIRIYNNNIDYQVNSFSELIKMIM